MQEQTTGEHFLAILVIGFSALVLLLAVAAYVAIGIMYPAEARAIERADRERIAAEHVEGLHRDADALNTIFYRLASDLSPTDSAELLRQLAVVEREIAARAAAGAQIGHRREWQVVQRSAAQFIEEGRRVLGPSSTTNAELFIRHQALTDSVAKLATVLFADQLAAQRVEKESSARRLRYTSILLGAALAVAMASAAAAIHVTRAAMQRARWQASELERLSSRTMSDMDALSQRLAHELHDHFGQIISAIEANLVAMQNRQVFDAGRIEDCLGLTKDAIDNVREVSQLLRPRMLDDFGLDASLRWLTERFTERTGIRAAYESDYAGRLNREVETQVFRIAQEALTNVGKHSGAAEVRLELKRIDGRLRLSVADNGKGFKEKQAETGLGLAGMRARARTARGKLMLAPTRRGTTVTIEIPLEGEPA